MPENAFQKIDMPEKIYYSIGEVGAITGLEPHVLRYWETEFSSLRPKKNNRGQRNYQKKDIELILHIKELLYNRKFTIAGARKALNGTSRADIASSKKNEEMTIFLKRLHNELLSLSKNLKGEKTDDLFGLDETSD